MRALVEVSQRIREIEFTEAVKRRLIDEMKDAVESVQNRPARDRSRSSPCQPEEGQERLREEDKKDLQKQIKDYRIKLKSMTDTSSRSRPS